MIVATAVLLASWFASQSIAATTQARTLRGLVPLKGHYSCVTSLAFSRDGKTLASSSTDSHIMLWDVATGKARGALVQDEGRVHHLSFNPDGTVLASGGASVKLWNVASGTVTKEFRLGSDPKVLALSLNRDGQLLAVNKRSRENPQPGTSLFSDITVFYVRSGKWDVATGKSLVTLWNL